jgi:hypothetical protein
MPAGLAGLNRDTPPLSTHLRLSRGKISDHAAEVTTCCSPSLSEAFGKMILMESIYLSAANPRLPLRSEADIQMALEAGLLGENHFLELKREIKAGKAENRETARDLASLAVDGGTLIVGLDEVDNRVQLSPQPLAGLAERLDQVAAMIPDPPLAIVMTPILSAADSRVGYLLVHVPPSPTAPHMVDGRYLGRGDKTKRYLSDAEVLRFHHLRSANEVDGLALLDAEFARDPFADLTQQHAHLFILAEPLTARSDLLLAVTDSDDWHPLLNLRKMGQTPELAAALNPVGAWNFSPGLDMMNTVDRRPAGVALSTYGIAAGRRRRVEEGFAYRESEAEIEVNDNGGLRLYSSRFSDSNRLIEATAVGFTRQLIAITAAAAEMGGYLGAWILGVGATRLLETVSSRLSQVGGISSAYGEDTYQRVVIASYADLRSYPGTLTKKLVGPLLRAYGTRSLFEPALTDPVPLATD